jgi:hypothetical protein
MWKSVMSIKHGSDDMEKRDSIVVKHTKNVSVGVKNMNYIMVRGSGSGGCYGYGWLWFDVLSWYIGTVARSKWCCIPDSSDL